MTGTPLSLEALNAMPASSFVAELGEAFEHAAWVAEAAAEGRPYPTVAALHEAMMQAVRTAPPDRLKAFIGGHPELGSRVKRAELTGPFPGRTGRARPRPAERGGVRPLQPAQCRLPGEVRLSLHHLRPPPHPGFDPAAVRAAACKRRGSRAGGSAHRDRPDHPAARGRHGRRAGQAEHRRTALDPRARHRERPPRPRREDRAARDRRERPRAPQGDGHQCRRPHRRTADRRRAASHRHL